MDVYCGEKTKCTVLPQVLYEGEASEIDEYSLEVMIEELDNEGP